MSDETQQPPPPGQMRATPQMRDLFCQFFADVPEWDAGAWFDAQQAVEKGWWTTDLLMNNAVTAIEEIQKGLWLAFYRRMIKQTKHMNDSEESAFLSLHEAKFRASHPIVNWHLEVK